MAKLVPKNNTQNATECVVIVYWQTSMNDKHKSQVMNACSSVVKSSL